jgi:hypothetical protein
MLPRVAPASTGERTNQGSGPGPLDATGMTRPVNLKMSYLRAILNCAPSVIGVITANIHPPPAIAGWDPRPAGVVKRTAKTEREEIPMVEPMVEMVMEVAPRRAPIPPLYASAHGH